MILDKYTHKITNETKGREDLAEYLNDFFNIKTHRIGWHIRLVNHGLIAQQKTGGREYHFIFSEIGKNGSRLYARAKKIRTDFIIHVYDDISEIFLDDKRKVAAFSAEPLEVY